MMKLFIYFQKYSMNLHTISVWSFWLRESNPQISRVGDFLWLLSTFDKNSRIWIFLYIFERPISIFDKTSRIWICLYIFERPISIFDKTSHIWIFLYIFESFYTYLKEPSLYLTKTFHIRILSAYLKELFLHLTKSLVFESFSHIWYSHLYIWQHLLNLNLDCIFERIISISDKTFLIWMFSPFEKIMSFTKNHSCLFIIMYWYKLY